MASLAPAVRKPRAPRKTSERVTISAEPKVIIPKAKPAPAVAVVAPAVAPAVAVPAVAVAPEKKKVVKPKKEKPEKGPRVKSDWNRFYQEKYAEDPELRALPFAERSKKLSEMYRASKSLAVDARLAVSVEPVAVSA